MVKKISEKETEYLAMVQPLLEDERIKQMDEFLQHGKTSCLDHCKSVSKMSYMMARRLHIKCDYDSLVRGALLHDYFLYDWHDASKAPKLHGFAHARIALANANKDFELTDIEKDIIVKHMFPLNIKPPKYRESVLVCIADKVCSLGETINRR